MVKNEVVKPWLVELMEEVAQWLPALGGRTMAVSDAEVTKENTPTLPIALGLIDRETVAHNPQSSADPVITDAFTIELWLENTKYKIGDAQSAFWAYRDHEPVRDILWSQLRRKQARERGQNLYQFVSMDVGVDTFAVVLTFRFNRIYTWCEPDELPAFVISGVTSTVCPISTECEKPCDDEPNDTCACP